jgi:Zn-dependent peptidase ImmA (M78 family)
VLSSGITKKVVRMNILKKGKETHKNGMTVKTDDYFNKRKEVMAVIYEAKKYYPNAPRVEVKICDKHERILGLGWVNKNTVIAINEDLTGDTLVHVVLHELVHTWFKKGHDEKCPLMKKHTYSDENVEESWDAFKKYAKKHTKSVA